MSLKNSSRLLLSVSIFFGVSAPSLAEYAEGALGYDWNPETKQFKRVYKDWQEGIVFDDKSGNYLVTYKDGYGEYNEVIFEPATKIEPHLKSRYKYSKSANAVIYEYRLKNGAKSKQNISMFLAIVSSISTGGPISPKRWEGHAVPTLSAPTLRLSWNYDGETYLGGLPPKKDIGGFMVESNDLPGITEMQIMGAAKATTWLGNIPPIDTPVGKQLAEIEANNFVSYVAAVPLIPVSNPFDAAAVLTSMQKHVNQDLVTMKLVDPTFASQLDRLFQAAIDAAKGGNTVALKSDIKDLRHMLKREHADIDKDDEGWDKNDNDKDKEKDKSRQIDKLAARVLDFDLKYIQKRLSHED